MKKSPSSERNRIRQPRAGGVRKASVPATAPAKDTKLSPARKERPMRLLEEQFSKDGEAHAVPFEYFNPRAREVLVAGTFNGWQPKATPMTKQRGGKWWTELLLQPGHYEYRFVVDGEWQDDPMASRFVANSFGGLNCVIEVKQMQSHSTSRP